MTKDASEQSTLMHAAVAAAPSRGVFVLVAVDGPSRGQSHVIDGSSPSRVLVGQSPVCEVRLDDRSVSRRHVALEVADRCLRVRDLDSTNGTFLGSTRVIEAFWHEGEVLRLGGTAMRLDVLPLPRDEPETSADGFGPVVGASPPMRRLYPLGYKLADSDVPVIIEGETGTGKEVFAEAIHELGPRRSGPFVVFDCTEVPENLVESELFGHEKGAFTGAVEARQGLFEQAHRGTLLIDEIGDLPLSLQPKLLRALERSEVRRVGGNARIRFDVRILAATRRDLDHEVQEGRFRDDLFHRLAVARIELPPLRKRRGDIARLARHFAAERAEELPPAVMARWESAPWPGNVRELRNAVARQLALGELAIDATAAPPSTDILADVLARDLPLASARQLVVDAFERRYLERLLDKHGGNVTHAARAAGVARRYLRLLKNKKLS
ncbi:MAG: sigma 54-interacting transcriptional regulator [Polyangiaceae bacterium]